LAFAEIGHHAHFLGDCEPERASGWVGEARREKAGKRLMMSGVLFDELNWGGAWHSTNSGRWTEELGSWSPRSSGLLRSVPAAVCVERRIGEVIFTCEIAAQCGPDRHGRWLGGGVARSADELVPFAAILPFGFQNGDFGMGEFVSRMGLAVWPAPLNPARTEVFPYRG